MGRIQKSLYGGDKHVAIRPCEGEDTGGVPPPARRAKTNILSSMKHEGGQF